MTKESRPSILPSALLLAAVVALVGLRARIFRPGDRSREALDGRGMDILRQLCLSRRTGARSRRCR